MLINHTSTLNLLKNNKSIELLSEFDWEFRPLSLASFLCSTARNANCQNERDQTESGDATPVHRAQLACSLARSRYPSNLGRPIPHPSSSSSKSFCSVVLHESDPWEKEEGRGEGTTRSLCWAKASTQRVNFDAKLST